MTNIIKGIDPDDYSVVEDADSASIATAHTPEIPSSNLPADKEQQVSDASDTIPLQYLRTLVKLRVATKSHHEECFLQAYSNIACQEFAGLSLQNYDTSSIKDAEARVIRRNTLFTDVIQNVDLVCASFDSAIKAYIRALNHDTKLTAIREHETYFRGVLDSAATTFNSLEFVTSPDSYLDKFILWLVSDEDFSLSNWHTYIAYHASPLVRYFLEKHIVDTEDWGFSKGCSCCCIRLESFEG
ncbi:hypothetical protein DL89DRAFT_269307 [Linderina pennispora]|uniref:Uncharacterized protein n=1 Tax=Linderina pennispora TaxID=61395 RepID=A0A1Y1W229_9FUNG|nr:uncharacterized protein DL89DRAFT_269307 [Linderina pennispora]ORX67502.1 hypothetical protein DL89DRAFT_269307 [Linderina pennispora]